MSDALEKLLNRGAPTTPVNSPAFEDRDESLDDGADMSDLSVMSDAPDHFDGLIEYISENPGQVQIEAMRQQIGGRASSLMRSAVRVAKEFTDVDESKSLLDDTIMSMRQSGLSHRKIAAELGGLSEDEVADRLAGMYSRMEQVTTAEYRMLQVGRLEQVINMCWDLASQGNAEHIELLIKAIERLNKMFELEREAARVEVEIVTNAQAVMLMSIITGVMNVLTSDPRIVDAIPVEEIQEITAKALDVAEAEIVDEDGNVKTL